MIDANLSIYSVDRDAPLHRNARSWLEGVMAGRETIGMSWNVLLAFLRLTTRHGAMRNPLPPGHAFDLVAAWLDQPGVSVVHPGPRHGRLLRDLLEPLGTGGNLTSDAHLAALAMEHGAELCSSDTDFARFRGLRWSNPLAGSGAAEGSRPARRCDGA